jgi:glutamate formiminotransferase/formiminotetrahydrofolate cyclodeaminase
VIDKITGAIASVDGVKLLNVDPGNATNRTVVTFVGEPDQVVEAAFRGIAKAAELIDMSKHSGEHPRMGATDVCPFIPVANISLEETVKYSMMLAEKVGKELNIPVYLYEEAQTNKKRSNLSVIRAGEYEGFEKKISLPEWKPDFGPAVFNRHTGATVIGTRDFLIAYNVNLNTKSVKRANSVAFDIREAGRIQREGNPVSGKVVTDENGEPVRIPGKLKGVKAIGWYIEEYGVAQVSINITRFRETPLHKVFDECLNSAHERGLRVTGSELVGLVPLNAMLDAGRYFLEKQELSSGVSDETLIHIAIKSMGLDELGPFDPKERIIEYAMMENDKKMLTGMSLEDFAYETASESPAPGGGSISAYAGALGTALGTMVANLSASKRGWEDRWKEFSDWAVKGQGIVKELLVLVDEDTAAFNAIMNAFQMPKDADAETAARNKAIQEATKYAIEVPLKVMRTCYLSMEVIKAMAEKGNPNSASDAGVGALCAYAGVEGAFLNVRINASSCEDKAFVDRVMREGHGITAEAARMRDEIMEKVMKNIEG